jgi:hypothetical protein
MKNTFLSLTALILISNIAFSNPTVSDKPEAAPRMAVVSKGSTVKVFYRGESLNRVTVRIFNAEGKIVLQDNLGVLDNFVRPYNFSNLEQGAYTIELSDDSGKQIKQVSYNLIKKAEKSVRLIKVANQDAKYVLMVPGETNDRIRIKIIDDFDRLVYEGDEELTGNFAKVYNVEKITKKFKVEIVDRNGISTIVNN